MSKSTFNIVVDAKLRDAVEDVCESMGINGRTAIKMFLVKLVEVGGLPFEPAKSKRNEVNHE